ncbi:hypothetical protein P153DRAFT_386502 [Dothidotthia symphoricarpi CBS 119687]|uniref:Uncharacterized protein n=1 Tax=Dothidotthia symphoricarpi CBS 119687 TaxID=1392245 RepID=A0A6A6ACE0_9PLEO|nr:uncharacterized protein P153DRAFT_386502 [Dothidotthia symphoricarpi CBS 119687]KAF2128381.1 hypothetical protein P153DRAFT_386502 [Dothidotthia symphoricarpi CBS 119687]
MLTVVEFLSEMWECMSNKLSTLGPWDLENGQGRSLESSTVRKPSLSCTTSAIQGCGQTRWLSVHSSCKAIFCFGVPPSHRQTSYREPVGPTIPPLSSAPIVLTARETAAGDAVQERGSPRMTRVRGVTTTCSSDRVKRTHSTLSRADKGMAAVTGCLKRAAARRSHTNLRHSSSQWCNSGKPHGISKLRREFDAHCTPSPTHSVKIQPAELCGSSGDEFRPPQLRDRHEPHNHGMTFVTAAVAARRHMTLTHGTRKAALEIFSSL